jgi:hypothetical protein
MKYKLHNKTECKYPFIAFLSNESIANINSLFNTHYTTKITNKTTIKRKEQEYGFWDKLIKSNSQSRVNEKG